MLLHLGEGKGVKQKQGYAYKIYNSARRYLCWVKLLEEATLWKPKTQPHISANRQLMSRQTSWFGRLIVRYYSLGKKKEQPLF